MAANAGSDNETYHEVPASKYWYFGDAIGAVPKAFFKFVISATIILTATGTVIACTTDWWQRLLQLVFFGSYWYVGWIMVALLVIVYLFKSRVRGGEKQK